MSSAKPGHFWELEAWMDENDVSIRELALLLGRGKNIVSRLVCGQFQRVDYRLQRDIKRVTRNTVTEKDWSAFFERRLSARAGVAA